MILKRILSIFLLIVFAFQVVPVRQVGSILYQNLLTEELPHHHEQIKVGWDEQKNPDLLHEFNFALITSDHLKAYEGSPDQEPVSRYADDIHTPPPNQII